MANKSFIERCEKSGINVNVVSSDRKKFVLIHCYVETGHWSIICFSDSFDELAEIWKNHPRFGSFRHVFQIIPNSSVDTLLNIIKDSVLINICKNVGELLSVGEYSMLKKSYFKSQAWFEKAKHSASLGADIINNY